ncbi:MAG: hypothetical protein ABSA67_04210 [Candidatus Brocadiia bacterium]|jgi:hypothetical protein
MPASKQIARKSDLKKRIQFVATGSTETYYATKQQFSTCVMSAQAGIQAFESDLVAEGRMVLDSRLRGNDRGTAKDDLKKRTRRVVSDALKPT